MAYTVPRVQIVPLPDDQVSFQVEGQERLRRHASPRYPRPFFYPLVGPSGRSLTRMGHPAAPDHDHHRSFWWGHHSIGGVNFWEERGGTQQIRQEAWIHYQDGDEEAATAERIGWFDAHKVRLVQQELITVFRPLPNKETWIELQTRLTPVIDKLVMNKTNFGLMGLRVAGSMSAHYGGGRLHSSNDVLGEKDNFAKQATWMDYSGPIVGTTWEGVTWFDHPSNPGHPVSWHVRDDGWMSPAFNLREAYTLMKTSPLQIRYGIHLHAGDVDVKAANARQKTFAASKAWQLVSAKRPWRWVIRRATT